MADEALFIGWSDVVRGRERKALDVFNESVQYHGEVQQNGRIEHSMPGCWRRTAGT